MSKKDLFVSLVFGLIAITTVTAQTTIPGGYVSGSWKASGSPYNVMGDITINADATLTIEAGTDIIFNGNFKLTVYGNLKATGTQTDSINFLPVDKLSGWGGIIVDGTDIELSYCNVRYVDALNSAMEFKQTNSLLSNCIISDNEGRTGAIWLISGSLTINCCLITRNSASYRGGGLFLLDNSSLNISNSLLSNNNAQDEGGGIWAYYANIDISGSIFRNNNAGGSQYNGKGGGIYLSHCQGSISDCQFSGNHVTTAAEGLGHTICLENSSPVISYSIFSKNGLSGGLGGGIYVGENSNPTIEHCVFSLNNSLGGGGGMHISSSGSMTMKNSIFYKNSYTNILFSSGCTSAITFCDFQQGLFPDFTGAGIPSGLGDLTGINANGDECDIFFNIFTDPLFVSGEDFNLTEQSPCIDAGDPGSPLDPDLTVTDIGRYYYDQSAPEIALSDSLLDFGSVPLDQQANIILKILNKGSDSLIINQIYNNQAVFSTDYHPSDSLILPGESISISVTFTPVNTLPVTDTLFIHNNDQDTIVKLTGTGQSSTGINDLPHAGKPDYLLGPAYPNPFHSATSFQLYIPVHSYVVLTVHNMFGAVVSTIVSGEMAAGTYKYNWYPYDLPGAIYILRLKIGDSTEIRKIIKL